MIAEHAPAKINLYLHIGPLRSDGLHDLASLFVFTETGDVIRAEQAEALSLEVKGPYADALKSAPVEDNLVWRAARLLQELSGAPHGAAITLEKNLPVAAGIGGGSADAAATLRALVKLWKIKLSDSALSKLAFSLGADVPACLARAPVNVSGAGEILSPGPILPPIWCCLVNPRTPMSTGPIFRDFDAANPAPPQPQAIRFARGGYDALAAALAAARNDLEPFASERAPVIAEMLAMLRAAPGALLARMSGSGATCFALFTSAAAASRAAAKANSAGWWAMASALHVR